MCAPEWHAGVRENAERRVCKRNRQMSSVFPKQLRIYLVLSNLEPRLLLNFGMNTNNPSIATLITSYSTNEWDANYSFIKKNTVCLYLLQSEQCQMAKLSLMILRECRICWWVVCRARASRRSCILLFVRLCRTIHQNNFDLS